MDNNIHLSIPTINNFQATYYFADDPEQYPPRVWPLHLHSELEIYILLEGDVSFVVETSIYHLSPGTAIIIKPNEMHNCILHSKSVHKHLCFWFNPSCKFLFDSFLSHDFGNDNLIIPDERSKTRLSEIYRQLKEATDNSNKQEQFSLTLQMLAIFRNFISNHSPIQKIPQLLSDILCDIDKNFKTIHSLSYLTEKFYISQSTLNRLFRVHLHTTPKMYVETKRLAHSRILLSEGRSVLDSCIEAGFPDRSNFIRLFKKRFSITPKQYQENPGSSN